MSMTKLTRKLYLIENDQVAITVSFPIERENSIDWDRIKNTYTPSVINEATGDITRTEIYYWGDVKYV